MVVIAAAVVVVVVVVVVVSFFITGTRAAGAGRHWEAGCWGRLQSVLQAFDVVAESYAKQEIRTQCAKPKQERKHLHRVFLSA
jgi:hypothetical protein